MRNFYLIVACFLLLLPSCQSNQPGENQNKTSKSTKSGEKTTGDHIETFMWMGASQLMEQEPKLFENILLFAERHNIIPYESGIRDTAFLRKYLKKCKSVGIEKTWIEIGPRGNPKPTIQDFLNDSSKRNPTLKRFENLARVYKDIYPNFARVTLFDEAPLGAFGHSSTKDGKRSYIKDVKDFQKYGPQAFGYMYKAFKKGMPNAEVGIFLHHPHNASSEMSGQYTFIEDFMAATNKETEVKPDFIFSDVYRGYFNRGYGNEFTNKYITDVVAHTSNVAEKHGIKAYQLGQIHTIKLGYTPSKRQIDENVEAMLEGNPDGLGWYWPNYASTNYKRQQGDGIGRPKDYNVSFNPFVPNAWGKNGPAGSLYGTSKDRFIYGYLRLKEETTSNYESTDRFDLWIYGHDFDHVEHSIYLKNNEGNWDLIGHFNPYHDASAYEPKTREKYIYDYNDSTHAIAFHALKRSRYNLQDLKDKNLEFKITTASNSDQSTIKAIYAMPYRETRHYVLEAQITDWLENQSRWIRINSLANHVRPVSKTLSANSSFESYMERTGTPPDSAQQWFNLLKEKAELN